MESIKCKCNKGLVKFETIGEDQYSAEMINSKCITKNGVHKYVCECGNQITYSDALLTTNIN